ncbi:MAG: thioredoxin domain-containing protein [Pyrinomonadaceae bacterium]
MNKRTILIFTLTVLFVCALNAEAQTRKVPATANKPAATPTSLPPGTLAVVNGQPITLADLDPQLRQAVESLDKQITDARSEMLQAQINRFLLEDEAKRRNVTPDQLLDAEVNSKVTAPTEAEIKTVYDENKSQIGNADLASVRENIITYLRNKQMQALSDDLIKRLRAATPFTLAANVNAPNLAPTAVLATVAKRPITAGLLNERFKPIAYDMRRRIYDFEKTALDAKINDALLGAEAQKRNTTPEAVFQIEVVQKAHHPTDEEVAKFYEDNKARVNGDLASLKPQIVQYLEEQDQRSLSLALVDRLRAGASFRILLKEPEELAQKISVDDDPARGDASAPVTIVEFTDYQCHMCGAMYPVIEEALKPYGNRVRFVMRDFPLDQHANARKAAEAADAASAQGKFWEYIAILFKNQEALDVPSLKKYASDLGLDRAKFDAALDNGTYAAEVSRDRFDGEFYGVNATPSIFINGVRLRDLTAEGLKAAIDRALAQGSSQAKPATK